MSFSRIFHHCVNGFRKAEDVVLFATLAVLVLLSFSQVAGRMLFDKGIPFADAITYELVLWIALLGAAMATRDEDHINIDILNRLLPHRYQNLVRFVTNLFSAFICSILCYAAVRFVIDEKAFSDMLFGSVPVWIARLILPAVFSLMALRFTVFGFRDLVVFIRGDES